MVNCYSVQHAVFYYGYCAQLDVEYLYSPEARCNSLFYQRFAISLAAPDAIGVTWDELRIRGALSRFMVPFAHFYCSCVCSVFLPSMLGLRLWFSSTQLFLEVSIAYVVVSRLFPYLKQVQSSVWVWLQKTVLAAVSN